MSDYLFWCVAALMYFVIGFVVLGWPVARTNDEVTVSQFIVLLAIWPPIAFMVYVGLLADSGIGRQRAAVYLQKIFGRGEK